MGYRTVGEIIEFTRKLHEALSHQYQLLEQLTTSERSSMILEFLTKHERELAIALSRYEDDAEVGVMDTWLQYSPEFKAEELLSSVQCVDLKDPENIAEIALKVDHYLVELYRTVTVKAEVEGVREVFSNLLAMEQDQQLRMARGTSSLRDF